MRASSPLVRSQTVVDADLLESSRRYRPVRLVGRAFLSPLRKFIGRIRVLAKDDLSLDDPQRRQIELMGGVAVFRPEDHDRRTLVAPARSLIDVCVNN